MDSTGGSSLSHLPKVGWFLSLSLSCCWGGGRRTQVSFRWVFLCTAFIQGHCCTKERGADLHHTEQPADSTREENRKSPGITLSQKHPLHCWSAAGCSARGHSAFHSSAETSLDLPLM